MKVCTCFLLFRIFAYTNSSPHNKLKHNGGTDLELKVDLELNVGENAKKVAVATNEKVINENKLPRPDFRAPRVETFTDFIQGLANILNTYENTAFADFFDILDEEIRKYHYRGCKFYELTENYEFRSLMAKKLHLIKKKSVPVLQADINEVVTRIRHGTYDKNVKELLEYINSLYREDAKEKFRKVLSDLKAYGNSTSERPKKYLVKIIRNGVRAIVFNHYTDLNINVRRELKKEIATFLKKTKETPSSSRNTNLFPYKPAARESQNTVKISGYNIAMEYKKPELSLIIDPKLFADNKNVFKLKASDETHKEEATKHDTSKEKSNSQQLQITHLSTDESFDETIEGNSIELSQERQRQFYSQPYATLYTEEISYMNTEKPEIIYKSAKSELVQRMLVEDSTGRLPTVQPTNAPELGLMSDGDLRRSIPPPIPGEELSIEVFDRDERKRQKSVARRNRLTTGHHGLKLYIRRMRNLRNKVNQLKKIDADNQNSRKNILTNGDKANNSTDEYSEEGKNHKDENKSKKIKKTKHVSVRESYEYESRAQADKTKYKVRKTKRDVTKTNYVQEDEPDLEPNKEILKNNAHKLKEQKMVSRSKSTKATERTKTNNKYKGSTDADDAVPSVNIRVRGSFEPLPMAKNNDGVDTTVNDNLMKLTKEEVKRKIINNKANEDYVTKDDSTRKYRRVLEFSSPPHYDQPFDDHLQ